MLLVLLAITLVPVHAQLVVNTTLPEKEDYATLYRSAIAAYFDDNDYTKSQQYLELAIADKR